VREAVKRDWATEQRAAANERLYASLRRKYAVTIEEAAR